MILKLNDTYQITTDNKNVVLEELKTIKDGDRKGEQYWSTVGYYPNFRWAEKGCMEHGLMTADVEGLRHIIECLERCTADIMAKCKEITG